MLKRRLKRKSGALGPRHQDKIKSAYSAKKNPPDFTVWALLVVLYMRRGALSMF
jgi:hypothetical protein